MRTAGLSSMGWNKRDWWWTTKSIKVNEYNEIAHEYKSTVCIYVYMSSLIIKIKCNYYPKKDDYDI